MKIYHHMLFTTFLLLLIGTANTQSTGQTIQELRKEYLNAKELYNLGKYELSMQAFEPLISQAGINPFQEHSSFYYALAAYNNNSKPLAKSTLIKLVNNFQDWDQIDEVYFWLAKISFENEEYFQGFRYANKVKGDRQMADNLKANFMKNVSDPWLLEDLLKEYPDDRNIALNYAQLLESQPLSVRDFNKIDSLVTIYGFERSSFTLGDIPSSTKKDEYNVAVLLPFMFDDLKPYRGRRSNQFILDLYEGMKLAATKLEERGVKINLYALDTKRDTARTNEIINNNQLNGMDVIVGPLYPGPVKIINDFSFLHKINVINPLSNNASIIEKNPFSFLYNPTSETIASISAEYVKTNIKNKNAVIYFGESQQDYIMAKVYREIIEADSFNVITSVRITRDNIKIIFDTMVEKYEVEDTLDLNPEEDMLEFLVIEPDSIGHIFVASGDRLIASNVISAVEARGDTIQIIGSAEWLDESFVDFSLIEKLGLWLYAPNYYSSNNAELNSFKSEYLSNYYELPSQNACIGYDLLSFLGRELKNNGKYFQVGSFHNEFRKGVLKLGYDYRFSNDNRVVPIIEFQNSELTIINDAESKLLSQELEKN